MKLIVQFIVCFLSVGVFSFIAPGYMFQSDIVIVTEEKKDPSLIHPLSNPTHQFVILQSQKGILIAPGNRHSASIDHYIQNSLNTGWDISAKDIFKSCRLTNVSNQKPIMVFKNLSIYCNKFQLKSLSGKLLSRIYYPKNHQVKGVYIHCHNSDFSHYFSSHNQNTFESYRLSKIPFGHVDQFYPIDQMVKAPNQWNYETIPIIIPSHSMDTMSGLEKYNQVIFVPFFMDETPPIIIPSVQSSALKVRSCIY